MGDGAPDTPITVKCRIGVADTTREALEATEDEVYIYIYLHMHIHILYLYIFIW